MLTAILTTFLAAIFVWHAWHHEIEFMPRMSPLVLSSVVAIPWFICLPAWIDVAESGWLYAIISTISAVIASGAVLALDHRYARLERQRQQDHHQKTAG